MTVCKKCGQTIIGPSVHLSGSQADGVYCTYCYTLVVAERLGIDFVSERFEPLVLKDAYGNTHTFHFYTMLAPTGIQIRAYEETTDGPGGYECAIIGSLEEGSSSLQARLVERLKRILGLKHLEENKRDDSFHLKDVVRGRVGHDSQRGQPVLIIDGRPFSVEQFGEMVDSYEGWQFFLKFVDPSEEID